jgi:alginate O-acetyltransferase complex protein AlgI
LLFNSYEFLFVFLPVVLAGFWILGRFGDSWVLSWLVLASLSFYIYWDSAYAFLLLASAVSNYFVGRRIAAYRSSGDSRGTGLLLFLGIAGNLAVLGYYKYAGFFAGEIARLLGVGWGSLETILPLGISFYTFTQIAFLVDASRGEASEYSLKRYLLFITWFPHLIAGPILHHKQMMPQFMKDGNLTLKSENFSVGLTLFVLGLGKKVLLADEIAPYATEFFNVAGGASGIDIADAWAGVLAYTLQLYFDFSGYSDMAIGLSLMFNVRLPLNFYSPYKSGSLIEFWRRWHVTLSNFLKVYVYIAVGGNRRGKALAYLNIVATMLIGGLWHGAGWTFIVWGGMHGIFLVINHAWRDWKRKCGIGDGGLPGRFAAGALTFVSVAFLWVYFRAGSIETAMKIHAAMLGFGSFGEVRQFDPAALFKVAALLMIVWVAPNTWELTRKFRPIWEGLEPGGRPAAWRRSKASDLIAWRPNAICALLVGLVFFACLFSLSRPSEFIYFQF